MLIFVLGDEGSRYVPVFSS